MTTASTAADGGPRSSLGAQIRDLDTRFWIVNTMEMLERLAYYGVRAVLALYIVLADELGGPEMSHVQKGSIFAAWAAVQSFLPIFTGGLADRYGHKRTIAVAILMKMAGYFAMATFKDYWGFWMGCMLLAGGTAIFKPGVQGTLAATMKRSSASVGWAIFYQLVNIGGFLGPVIAGLIRNNDNLGWPWVFYGCAMIVAINFLWLPFYEDPSQHKDGSGEEKQQAMWSTMSRALDRPLVEGWSWFLGVGAVLSAALAFAGPGSLLGKPILASALDGHGAGWYQLILFCTVLGLAGTLAGLVLSRLEALWHYSWAPMGVAALASLVGVQAGGESGFSHLDLSQYTGTDPSLLAGAWSYGFGLLMIFAGAATFFYYYRARKPLYDAGQLGVWDIIVVSVVGLFQHRVFWFCIVFAGFWFMFNQVFDLLPNMIDDWVDSSQIIGFIGSAFSSAAVPSGLALFLAVVFGCLCGGVVYLAMRPDRRPVSEVPSIAFVVVVLPWFAITLLAQKSLGFQTPATLQLLVGVMVALGLGFLIQVAKVPARPLSLAAAVAGFASTFVLLRSSFLESSAELILMAERGEQVNPEWLINLNPGLIVFTVVFFGYLSSFVRPLTSIIIGMAVATAGSLVAGTAVLGWACLAGILIFSVGEMLSSPKKMEYLATLAKKGQEGLFMGYANAPVGIGWIAGSILAGNRYETHGDKVVLARRHMVDVLGMSKDSVEALPKTEVLSRLAAELGTTAMDAQTLLYQTYHPEKIWIFIAVTGFVSIVSMVVYDRVLRYVDRNAQA